ncbi:MAG: lysoplasmalogenase [Spirochaetaceae bacterium]|nr:lysoplasmalogenase [Spirochaetaceae bacterium]
MLKVFITIFFGISATYLVSLLLKKRNIEVVTKICLLPSLLGVYVCGAENLFVPVIFALIFGWGGDVFLLKISDIRFFRLGLASFLIGHLCYIPSFIFFTERINGIVLLISIALGFPLCFVIYLIIKPEKAVSLYVIAYEIIIMLMSLSALQLMLSRRDIRGLLVFAGSLCFLVSDTLLACFTFRGKVKYGNFFVILFYIAAQSAIIGGMMGV